MFNNKINFYYCVLYFLCDGGWSLCNMRQGILGNIWGQCILTRLKVNFFKFKLSFTVPIDALC